MQKVDVAERGNGKAVHDTASSQQRQIEGRAVVGHKFGSLGEELDCQGQETGFTRKIVDEHLAYEKAPAIEESDRGEEGNCACTPRETCRFEVEERQLAERPFHGNCWTLASLAPQSLVDEMSCLEGTAILFIQAEACFHYSRIQMGCHPFPAGKKGIALRANWCRGPQGWSRQFGSLDESTFPEAGQPALYPWQSDLPSQRPLQQARNSPVSDLNP